MRPPIEHVRTLLRYDEHERRLFWLKDGSEAGYIDIGRAAKPCMIHIRWNDVNRRYRASVVCFALKHGRWPEGNSSGRDMSRAALLHDPTNVMVDYMMRKGDRFRSKAKPVDFSNQDIPQELIDAEVA